MARQQNNNRNNEGADAPPDTITWGERMAIVKEKIELPENWSKFSTAAAKGVDVQRYAQMLYRACGQNLKVLNSSIDSIALALLESVSLGLPIGSSLGYGYIVPRKNRAQFQAGYLGLLKLAYNDGRATTASAEVVRGNDRFRYMLGTSPAIRHQRNSKPDDDIKWAWGSVSVLNGPPFVEVWPAEYLTQHARKYVQTDKSGHYYSDALIVTNYEMWCRKTMLRRCLKFMPMSEMARSILQREEYSDEGIDLDQPMESGDEVPPENLRELVSAAPPIEGE